jgi:hypothetical protein
MSNNSQNYVLKIIRGPSKGKRFRLTKDEVSIGSGSDNDVQQAGQYMSEVHAVINKRSDGSWFVTNRSPSGTFLNRTRVDSHVLANGDFIQFGSEVLVQFAVDETAKKKRGFGKGADGSKAGGKKVSSMLSDRPGVVIGVGAYLLAMVALIGFFAFGDFSNEEPALGLDDVSAAVERTRTILLAQKEIEPKYRATTNTDDSALFYSIIASAKLPDGDNQREQRIDRLVTQLDERFFVAWNHEKRKQLEKAIEEYEKIVRMAPDIRIPTTQLASKRLAFIRGELISG